VERSDLGQWREWEKRGLGIASRHVGKFRRQEGSEMTFAAAGIDVGFVCARPFVEADTEIAGSIVAMLALVLPVLGVRRLAQIVGAVTSLDAMAVVDLVLGPSAGPHRPEDAMCPKAELSACISECTGAIAIDAGYRQRRLTSRFWCSKLSAPARIGSARVGALARSAFRSRSPG
jgi:hypothetical protein